MLDKYADIAGHDVVEHLKQLARPLAGLRLIHINSTKSGGGVAEILHKMVPLMRELGIDVQWEVISGEPLFYECTKGFHNAMQGNPVNLTDAQLRSYEETNKTYAETSGPLLKEADVVLVHDPQPAALISSMGDRKGKWVWRCHIDASHPFRPVWRYLRDFVKAFDASIFSIAPFSQRLPHPVYLIAPSIDPLHEKNMELPLDEIESVYDHFHIDPERPMVLQVSRFDRFKDPIGLIHAYRIVKPFIPTIQLVLAGGGASDDPEGDAVLNEVRIAAADDTDIHVLLLPGDAHRTINALQRAADIVIQKSLREGFGLTVTEAMWKNKPVVGGDTGGIRLQVLNHHTGFLANTPEGTALRIRYLLSNPEIMEEMGKKARQFVLENFLITRHVREYLTLILALLHGDGGREMPNGSHGPAILS